MVRGFTLLVGRIVEFFISSLKINYVDDVINILCDFSTIAVDKTPKYQFPIVTISMFSFMVILTTIFFLCAFKMYPPTKKE